VIDRIEVYVRSEKVITGQRITEPLSDGVVKHQCFSKKVLDTEKVMPEVDKQVLETVKEFAKERSLSVEVYDVSSYKGKLKTVLKGIKKTPTIVIGTSRIEGDFTPSVLKNKLDSCLNE
jgi:hypothetical protein